MLEALSRYALAALGIAAGTLLCILAFTLPDAKELLPVGTALLGVGAGSRLPSMPGNRFLDD
jgi:hypothetical protein